METPSLEDARRYALRRLQGELAGDLLHHNVAHTQANVVPAAERLATAHGTPDCHEGSPRQAGSG